MTQPQPPSGGAVWSPDGKGGGSYRPVLSPEGEKNYQDWLKKNPPPPSVASDNNPFRTGGTSVADIEDPMARRFDALSPEDQDHLRGLGEGARTGKVPMSTYAREMQRLMYGGDNKYGPAGSLPGEAGFFPPNLGQPTPLEAVLGGASRALAPVVDFAAVLNQINQTNQVIGGAPVGPVAKGSMTLGTMGAVGTAATAAGAAATGLPLAGVAGIGAAGAAVPMAAATAFGAASGQEGTDPWGGVPHPGVGVAGPKASDPVRRSVRPQSFEPPMDMPDHYAIGQAHGAAIGEGIRRQMMEVFRQLPEALNNHVQDHLNQQGFGG